MLIGPSGVRHCDWRPSRTTRRRSHQATRRVWGEPETGGEAYIPLKKPVGKRQLDILKMTAAHLGHGVVPMADGGVLGADPAAKTAAPALVQTSTDTWKQVAAVTQQQQQIILNKSTDTWKQVAQVTHDQQTLMLTGSKTQFTQQRALVDTTMTAVVASMTQGATDAGQHFVDALSSEGRAVARHADQILSERPVVGADVPNQHRRPRHLRRRWRRGRSLTADHEPPAHVR